MYIDRYSGISAKRILSFGQFSVGGDAGKNFLDLPKVCYFLEQFYYIFMWKRNEELDFLDTLAFAPKSYPVLKQKKYRSFVKSILFVTLHAVFQVRV